jgi:hypothetical protein
VHFPHIGNQDPSHAPHDASKRSESMQMPGANILPSGSSPVTLTFPAARIAAKGEKSSSGIEKEIGIR